MALEEAGVGFDPSLVAEWGLDYFDAERRHTHRALASLGETAPGDTDATA